MRTGSYFPAASSWGSFQTVLCSVFQPPLTSSSHMFFFSLFSNSDLVRSSNGPFSYWWDVQSRLNPVRRTKLNCKSVLLSQMWNHPAYLDSKVSTCCFQDFSSLLWSLCSSSSPHKPTYQTHWTGWILSALLSWITFPLLMFSRPGGLDGGANMLLFQAWWWSLLTCLFSSDGPKSTL